MSRFRLTLRVTAILFVVFLAAALRLRAAQMLPIDFDEDDYLRAGQQFATAIQAGDWPAFTRLNYRTEHPPLQKIVYGIAIAPLPPVPEIPDRPTTAPPNTSLPQPHRLFARSSGVLFGSLEVLLLALLNPLAALLLAIHTWDIKYVSQVQIEAVAALTSALAVLAFHKSGRRWNGWMFISALGLGLTAASKYTYCIVGIVIVIEWLRVAHQEAGEDTRRALTGTLVPLVGWGMLALVVFFAADPYLWPDPLNRLRESVFYHFGYATSEGVTSANYPPWQPLVWLSGSVPWHPGVFVFMLDLPITLLAALGFPSLWRQQRLFALWLVIGLGFLLVWPTKWPQYVLMISMPLALAGALGLRSLGPALADRVQKARQAVLGLRFSQSSARETRRALPWLLPGTLVLLLISLFPLLFQGAMSLTDFNALSIKDGLNGGVFREALRGLTGQAPPVIVSISPNGRVSTQVVLTDRGEPHAVPLEVAGLDARDVHYAGPSFLISLLSGIGADLLFFEILWTGLSLALQAGLGIGVALMLNRSGLVGRGWWRALFVLPWAIPEFVGALMWLRLFEPEHGWLALLLGHPLGWHGDPLQSLGVLLLASLWLGFPLMMLAGTAGLRQIPTEVYDAAAVDGVNRWQRFRYVTFPLLLPLLVPALIIRGIYDFNQFYLFYVVQTPYPLTTFANLSFLLFNVTGGFGGQFAIAAAINVFTVILLLAFLLVVGRKARLLEGVRYA